MTMRKMLAVLATLAILCTVLPLGAIFSASADANVIENSTFDDGLQGWNSDSNIHVEDGILTFECTKDWANVYKYANGMKANTDYVYTFRAKANMNSTMNIKINDNWASDSAHVKFDVTTEWQEFTVDVNSGDFKSAAILMFSANVPASTGLILYLDYVIITEKPADEPETPDEPANDNLIVNGDLETGDIKPWENLWGGCPTAEVIEGGKDSKYALNIVSKTWNHVRQTNIAVEANTDYKISVWAKNAANMCLLVKDGGDTTDIANVGVNAGDEWTLFTVEFNSGSFTSIIFSLMGGEGDGQYGIFDNIVMEKVGGETPDTPDEPEVPSGDILNATFDGGEFDGILSSSDISVADGELQFNVTKDWGNVYTGFEVEANTDYEVSFRAKSKLGKTVWAKFHKADWTGDICQETAALSTSWKDYTYTMNSGDNTYVYLLIQYAGYASEGETVWFDYITVKKVGGDAPDVPAVDSGIVNGSFENGSDGWELSSSASITDEDAKDGSHSLRLENPGMWSGAAVQTVPVKPNTEYVVKMWFNRITGTSPFNLYIMDAADNRNIDVIEGQNWFNTKTVDWEERVLVINTGAASEIVLKWSSEASNAGVILIDNMSIAEKNAPAPSAGLVVNGDFETGDTTGWEKWQSTVVSEEAAKNGKYGVNLIGNGGWGGLLNQSFKVEKGETYVITLWACVNASGANLQIKGADKVEGECDNTYLDANELSGWTERTFTVVANSDEITLNFCGGGTNKAEDLYIDDIVVVKKGETPPVDETYPIKNAGFETGDLSGGWNNLWNSCTYTFETPGHDKSNYAISIEAPGNWQQIRQDGVPVEPNTDYTLIAYVKNPINFNVVVKTGDDSANIADFKVENDMSNTWIRLEVPFNSGEETAVCVLLIGNDQGPSSALFDNVQIYKKGEEPAEPEPDAPATEGPIQLDYFGVAINRPANDEANLILNGSFENAEGGQWQSIIGDTLYVVDDETAPEGNKSLFFNTSGVKDSKKTIFYVDVVPNTDYVFSAWVKGAYISADNRFNATFGVTDWKDNFCVYADAVFSNKTRQIVPTAWDNEWHLRSVQFNSGANIKVGIGFAGAESQMWIDGIALYEVINGVKYADPKSIDYIMGSELEENQGACADEHNLIVDSTMGSADAQEFWASAEGFKNGFISFPENEYEYGTSMKYTGSDASCYTHAIKWFTVEPNTDYTFSVDMRVVKTGGGSLTLYDGKLRDCNSFLTIDFDQYVFETDWNNITVKFNTGEFDRIGIAIVDGGGEALLDNMRLFKTEYTIEGGIVDDYIDPPYDFDDPTDPEKPDSPATGVSVMGAVLAVALVPASAAAAFKLRRKKEDEE